MSGDLKEFWNRHLDGVDVAVASGSSGVLLGVRDGFQRFLTTSFEPVVPVAIVAQPPTDSSTGLLIGEDETFFLARRRARELEEQSGKSHDFHIGAEGGLRLLRVDGETIYFVQCWASVRGLGGETWGSSGALQVPSGMSAGLEGAPGEAVLPATRRRGGLLGTLSHGRETRRSATALAVCHALSTRFYGALGIRVPWR